MFCSHEFLILTDLTAVYIAEVYVHVFVERVVCCVLNKSEELAGIIKTFIYIFLKYELIRNS
jgi:hypothetical protein